MKLKANPLYVENVLHNVVAILPGTTQAHEAVLFSAHYDHVDVDLRSGRKGLYNGANDNASGTTAVLQLARYYAMRGPQPRTLIFACFAGEEIGLLGSAAFVGRITPENIVANINIEMIGMNGASGRDAFFLTGPRTSTLRNLMRKNLAGTKFRVEPEPADNLNLFERSDNFTFFEKGIPAHSIMCSDDRDPCYHLPCDDFQRIDTAQMNRVIIAIARSVSSIVEGREKPRKTD
jgi:Zn-dependent M28 family amino/carboxypeptidase